MKRKIIKFTMRPYDVTGHNRMNFNLNVGEEFVELEPLSELLPPEEGFVFGFSGGHYIWVPESHLSSRS